MPTTTEVEARLRRTAAACEPVVDAAMAEAVPPTARSRRTGWLAVAATVLVLAVGAGALAVTGDDDPGDDVRTSAPPTIDRAPASTDPRAAASPTTASATLVDGTVVFLQIPGPDRWSQVETLVEIEIGDTATAEPGTGEVVVATVVPSVAGGGEPLTVARRVSDGVAVVEVDGAQRLAVEGVVRTLLVPIDGLDDDQVERLGDGLRFDEDQDELVTIRPSGVSLVAVGARLDLDRFLASPGLTVWRPVDGGQDPACADPDALPRSERCIDDGRLRIVAGIDDAQVVLPGITGEIADGPVVQHVPLAFADGTRLVVSLPGSSAFLPGGGTAELAIDGERLGYPILQLYETTAEGFAAEERATLTPLGPTSDGADQVSGTWRADADDGRSWLLVGGGAWVAALPISMGDGDLVPSEVVDRLADDLRVTPTQDGLVDLGGPGITVAQATRAVQAQAGFYPAGIEVRVGPSAEQACRAGVDRAEHQRCFADGRVLVLADPVVEPNQPAAVDLDTVEIRITDG